MNISTIDKEKIINKHGRFGFTVIELILAISLFAVIIILVGSMYSLAQQSYNKGAAKNEMVQNARVSLDRITRELRQSVAVVTALPTAPNDPEDPAPSEILFQDGHDIGQAVYLRYYLDGTNLKRSKIAYYFSEEPDIYVTYDSIDQFSNPPDELLLEDRIVGEYFSRLAFWNSDNVINISIGLAKGADTFNIETGVFSRN